MTKLPFSLLLACLAISQTGNAAPTFYTNSASFSTATLGYSFITEDFTTATPGDLAFNTPLAFNGFSVTATQNLSTSNDMGLAIYPSGNASSQHAPFTTSQYLGWAEDTPYKNGFGVYGPTITFNFTSALQAISFNFLDADNTDEYYLLVNGVAVGSAFPAFATTNDAAFFFGIIDPAGINSLTFTTNTTSPGGLVEEFGIDNIKLSNIPATTVPTPTALWLLGVGLLGFARNSRLIRRA